MLDPVFLKKETYGTIFSHFGCPDNFIVFGPFPSPSSFYPIKYRP